MPILSTNFSQGLGQRQEQGARQNLAVFTKLLTNTELEQTVSTLLQDNILFDGVISNNLESIDDNGKEADEIGEDNGMDSELFDVRAEDDQAYKSEGDGPAINDIPDDRKSYLATSDDLINNLESQLAAVQLSIEQREVAKALINSVDDRGFIENTDEVYHFISSSQNVYIGDVEDVHNLLIANLEPAGVLTNGVQASLLAQLARYDQNVLVEKAKIVVSKFLNEFQSREDKLSYIAKKLNESTTYSVENVFKLIEELNPYPITTQNNAGNAYKISREPDLIVHEWKAGQYLAYLRNQLRSEEQSEIGRQVKKLNNAGGTLEYVADVIGAKKSDIKKLEKGELTLNDTQLSELGKLYKIDTKVLLDAMAKDTTFLVALNNREKNPIKIKIDRSCYDKELQIADKIIKGQDKVSELSSGSNKTLVKEIVQAKREIDNVKQMLIDRDDYLSRLVTYAVNYQQDFISTKDNSTLKPLTLTMMAETFKVSESTISAAFNEKYVQFPNGEVSKLKSLLDSGRVNENDERISKAALNEFIKENLHEKPLVKDSELVVVVKEKYDLNITLNYVSKLRESLGLPTYEETVYNTQVKPIVESRLIEVLQKEDRRKPLSDAEILAIIKNEDKLDIGINTFKRVRENINIPASTSRFERYKREDTLPVIQNVLKTEDKNHPFSDADLARIATKEIGVKIDIGVVKELREFNKIADPIKRSSLMELKERTNGASLPVSSVSNFQAVTANSKLNL